MGQEIERKFLVRSMGWKAGAVGIPYRQGYLCRQETRTVRVRIAGDEAYLTIKGQALGIARLEGASAFCACPPFVACAVWRRSAGGYA